MQFDWKKALMGFALGALVSLFVVALNTLMVVNAFDATFINPEFDIQLFEKHGFYTAFYAAMPTLLEQEKEGLSERVQKALTPELFKQKIDQIIVDTLEYLKGPNAEEPILFLEKSDPLKKATEITLSSIFGKDQIQQLKDAILLTLSLKTPLLAASLVMLALIALIPKALHDKLKKTGYALFLTGIAGVFFFLAMDNMRLFLPLPVDQAPEGSIQKVTINLLLDASRGMGSNVLWQSLPVLGIGIVLMAEVFWLSWKESKKQNGASK